MRPRYAIYFAPDRDSLLWERGCQWLGRDPEQLAAMPQPRVAGCDPAWLQAITAWPRRYGFHATLKPPFSLRPGCDAAQLRARLETLCAAREGFDLPALEVARLAGFVALRPTEASASLQSLADACVLELDDLRAPPAADELARRRSAGLNARREALLARFGYPYVLDQFRFHLTLTERLDADGSERLITWLRAYFADALRQPMRVGGVCLFVQDRPDADFTLARRFTFAG